ncbi:MAG TPA: ribosome maturation factor RimM [Stellaceae bacterium]|jgi:16S rRNA processing protein RimM|nr:ribosome maturation factor RimM [Stellaceae bacterium]
MPDRVRGRQAPPAPSKTEDAGEGDSARICVGIITGVHGIKGWVRVKSFTAAPEAIAAYGPLADDSGTRRIELELVGAGKGVLLARINGIDDRNAAERLKGLRLYVRRADLPPPDKDEFYQADLIGLSAERADGTRFGTVRAVNDFGAGASIEIEDEAGKMVVVPFTAAAVPVVDVAGKRVVVVPPAGLLDAPTRDDAGEG